MNTSKDSRLAVVYGAKFISSLLNDQDLLNSLPKNVLYTSLRQMSLKEHSLTFEFFLTSPIKLDKITLNQHISWQTLEGLQLSTTEYQYVRNVMASIPCKL